MERRGEERKGGKEFGREWVGGRRKMEGEKAGGRKSERGRGEGRQWGREGQRKGGRVVGKKE